jgi:hypothetical protein
MEHLDCHMLGRTGPVDRLAGLLTPKEAAWI